MEMMIDTGVSWIGAIPQSWKLGKVKFAFDRKKEKSTDKDPVVLSLARKGVKVRDISTNEGQLAASYEGYNIVEPGDLLLNPMDLLSGANCSISYVSGVISPAYMNLRAKPGFEARFYDYYFKSQYWSMAMFAHGKGVSFDNRWTLNENVLRDYFIPMPPHTEQVLIADYLDDICAKIDEIIDEAKVGIEEYQELKNAMITTATTKGLSNEVVKPSGSRWVETIPESWNKTKIHYIIDMPVIDGPHVSPELVSGGVDFISANAIVDGKIDFNKRRGFISREYSNECRKRYAPKKDDILVVKLGASTGKMAMVEDFTDFDIWVPLAVVRCKKGINPRFVYHAMSSQFFKDEIRDGWSFGTQETLGVKTLESLHIFLPSKEEQVEIVKYLDEQIPKYDSLIKEKQMLIEDLESYKKSIIFECVTGKRRVV